MGMHIEEKMGEVGCVHDFGGILTCQWGDGVGWYVGLESVEQDEGGVRGRYSLRELQLRRHWGDTGVKTG